ncbi:hypothetical protein O181_046353 [Austropuccinia psidii MF-1]|uniref:DUF7872 domain-containing protein n=1 Tax=Austropuccinia psidii MF-1 TaxID=1389203 RepID=A0A9Q3DTW2_9BASI|nr:hypothetical protein [Austropuccinia psidii MF-1]
MLPSFGHKSWKNASTLIAFSAMFSLCSGSVDRMENELPRPHLAKRGQLMMPDSSTNSLTGLGAGGQTTRNPCDPVELAPKTWVDLGIDEYLANYPNADKLTIQQFAAELNVPNFFCGIGMQCLAGQLCSPAAGVNWLILYAVQEWNNYMNSLYQAIEEAVSGIRDASADIVSDFMPHEMPDSSLYGWSIATIVVGALGAITAPAVPLLLPKNAMDLVTKATAMGAGAGLLGTLPKMPLNPDSAKLSKDLNDAHTALNSKDIKAFQNAQEDTDDAVVQRWQEGISPRHDSQNPQVHQATSQQAVSHDPQTAQTTQEASPQLPHTSQTTSNDGPPHLHKRSLGPEERPKIRHPTPTAFTQWSFLTVHLTVLQNRMQGYISSSVRAATQQPILAQNGLASILQQGNYLYQNPTQPYLSADFKALAKITALSKFFKATKMFVTIGSDDCKYAGPNGAKNRPGQLSFCTKEGLMMNLIRAHGDKAVNKIENAELLKTKYGYSVEYLARTAWECQKKYGVDSEATAPPPTSSMSDCVFSIPVCDCTLPQVSHLRHRKKTTVEACRKGAKLPI